MDSYAGGVFAKNTCGRNASPFGNTCVKSVSIKGIGKDNTGIDNTSLDIIGEI